MQREDLDINDYQNQLHDLVASALPLSLSVILKENLLNVVLHIFKRLFTFVFRFYASYKGWN